MDLGKTVKVKALGQEWTFSRLELSIIEEFRDWIAEQIGDPFTVIERLAGKVPDNTIREMIKDAESTVKQLRSFNLDLPVCQEFLATPGGIATLFRMMLAKHHPEVDRDTCMNIFLEIGQEQVSRILSVTQGAPQTGGKLPPVGK